MTDEEIFSLTYGWSDIPPEHREDFNNFMLGRGYPVLNGEDRFYRGDVREFFLHLGLPCPPPGRRAKE